MTTTNYGWNLPTVGGSEDTWGTQLNANWTALDTLLGGTNATEFAILDGATVSTAELNILDGVTSSTAELNLLDGVTWTLTDFNSLTATPAELNTLDGINGIASQAEAEAGTATDKLMTPERTKQAIDNLSSTFGGTWTNVTGSRSNGTTYTNDTGKFIMVNIFTTTRSLVNTNGEAISSITATVNGVSFIVARDRETFINWSGFTVNSDCAGNFIVPPGATYSVSASPGISTWHELR